MIRKIKQWLCDKSETELYLEIEVKFWRERYLEAYEEWRKEKAKNITNQTKRKRGTNEN